MSEERLQKLEEEVAAIKARNARVEADKAWETSAARMLVLAAITFAVTAVALYFVGNEHPVRDAFIAAIGFIFSTLSLSFLRKRSGNFQ